MWDGDSFGKVTAKKIIKNFIKSDCINESLGVTSNYLKKLWEETASMWR